MIAFEYLLLTLLSAGDWFAMCSLLEHEFWNIYWS